FLPEAWQIEVVCALTSGRDAVLAAGTGRGKSLLWDLASLLMPTKIFPVVVPLQAIEIDQVKKHAGTSITAIALSQSRLSGK
ncbi:hypothetical protein V8E36_006267, partial [Tilletia maclaganii]